jgi:glycosyltransferase involved in cell wall biosynthesis
VTPPVTISVVTPSYNQARYIEATLQSVIDQDFAGLEYVVIDGGSNDGSVEIIQRHQEQLAYWVSEPDKGHANALNKGLAETSGEILCWLNSSDMYYPWTLRTVAQIFSELPQVEWIMGLPTHFSSTGGPRSVGGAFFNVYDVLAGNYRWIQQESVFWRRSLWERSGGRLDETLTAAADFDLWLRFFRLAPLFHVETILGGWRVHDNALGDQETGPYQREAEAVFSRFSAQFDRRFLRRAQLVRALATGNRQIAGRALNRVGAWPWYEHPRVSFDFQGERWITR